MQSHGTTIRSDCLVGIGGDTADLRWGNLLRQARLRAGLTQRQTVEAAEWCCAVKTYSLYETGSRQPSARVLNKLFSGLGVTPILVSGDRVALMELAVELKRLLSALGVPAEQAIPLLRRLSVTASDKGNRV